MDKTGPNGVTLTALPEVPSSNPGPTCLADFEICENSGPALADGDVLVVAQKIVSKAEGRYVTFRSHARRKGDRAGAQVQKDPRLVEVILGESRQVCGTDPAC